MSAIALCVGGKAPIDRDQNKEFHQGLIDRLLPEMERQGWLGAKITLYRRAQDYVSLEIEAGVAALTLQYLRTYRLANRQEQEGMVA